MASLDYPRYVFSKQKYNAVCSVPVKNECLAVGGTICQCCISLRGLMLAWGVSVCGWVCRWVEMKLLCVSHSRGRQGENWFLAWLFSGQPKMVTGFRPRSLFPYQIVYIGLLAEWTSILKNCEKVNCEQRVEIGTAWKRTYVIEVPGAPVLWVIVAFIA